MILTVEDVLVLNDVSPIWLISLRFQSCASSEHWLFVIYFNTEYWSYNCFNVTKEFVIISFQHLHINIGEPADKKIRFAGFRFAKSFEIQNSKIELRMTPCNTQRNLI